MSRTARSKKASGCSAQTPIAHVVDGVLQVADRRLIEAAAEVAGGGRVREATGAQGVEEDLVLAAEFQVLQTRAVAQGVVGEGQDVVGLVVREVEFEEVQAVVNGVDETDPAHQGVEGADAAAADRAGAVGDLVVDVGGGEHGPSAAVHVGPVETALDAALAVGQLSSYPGFHLKSLRSSRGSWRVQP